MLEEDTSFKLKRIEVAGGQLSLQWHHHRSEYWIVVMATLVSRMAH
jgi:mannose-6-phosphate isomerase-like protein (cupin superfamily)